MKNEQADAGQNCRTRILRRERGQGIFFFPVQLTTSRIGNLTRLIHTLAIQDDNTYIHTYIHTYCRESAGTGPVVLKVVPVTVAAFLQVTMDQLYLVPGLKNVTLDIISIN